MHAHTIFLLLLAAEPSALYSASRHLRREALSPRIHLRLSVSPGRTAFGLTREGARINDATRPIEVYHKESQS